jgi:hypothetical protein
MRRFCLLVLVLVPLTLAPFSGANAKPNGGGGNNRGGSDRSHEVRQNGENAGNAGNGGRSGGTGTPDAGDNRHPSGNDRSVESGGSYPQGHSQSDPDGMTNGGADKPGGTGGIDQADQDGNNGCGNDDDFEDDNNGNCGKPVEPAEEAIADATAAAPDAAATPRAARLFTASGSLPQIFVPGPDAGLEPAAVVRQEPAVGDTRVLSSDAERVTGTLAAARSDANVAGPGTVGGIGGLLPLTGAEILRLVAVALALVVGGRYAMRYARSRRAELVA